MYSRLTFVCTCFPDGISAHTMPSGNRAEHTVNEISRFVEDTLRILKMLVGAIYMEAALRGHCRKQCLRARQRNSIRLQTKHPAEPRPILDLHRLEHHLLISIAYASWPTSRGCPQPHQSSAFPRRSTCWFFQCLYTGNATAPTAALTVPATKHSTNEGGSS